MTKKSFVDEELLAGKKSWRDYFAAKLGFRNHWYAACLSREITEGAVVARTMLGEEILLRRINGKVYAIADRCIHRGVKLSDKIECHTADTISCWYHGFTYRWNSGEVVSIFGAPESSAIGTKRTKTYPTAEVNGVVFAFIGDTTEHVPDISKDIPASFLDSSLVVEGECYMIQSNWRLGPEGGLDEIHRYLHRESPLLLNTKSSVPLGHTAIHGQFELIEEGEGPFGIIDRFAPDKMFFDAKIDGKVVASGPNFGQSARKRTVSASVWMPGCLRVEGFPDENITLYEWYVPVDENTHRCFMTLAKSCAEEQDSIDFRHAFQTRWKPLALEGFLRQDVMARESAQKFYANDRGWLEECLIEEDFMLIEWRKLCSRRNRGVQAPEHII
jgi:carbazole 1,9a-dioxygenase